MKKITSIILAALAGLSFTGCGNFLDTNSPSVVDADFVFSNGESAKAALYYGYKTWQSNRSIHSVGWFWTPVWGSDIEDCQDAWNEGDAGQQEKAFYPGGTANYNINAGQGTEVFGNCYRTIAICNSLIAKFEALPNFDEIMTGEPNALSDIYGQAFALRATQYYELCRWYGDVPYATKAGEKATGLTSRFAIYDKEIAALRAVEPHMFRPGENGARADVMNRTYVQGLIARLCLYNGGYATRRTDLGADFYVGGDGARLSFDDWSVEKDGAIYGRRSDWKQIFEIAKGYLLSLYENSGSVVLHTSDPRSNDGGRSYGNPFQYAFAQLHQCDNISLADESIYEIVYAFANPSGGSDRPGYIGRPSSGGNNGAPCIACGQDRVQAWFYYSGYDNADMRRDASICVTGSTGKGTELMQSFNRSAWGAGCGPGTNKWDWNKMTSPNTSSYGMAGINASIMRISDAYLMLAEVYAALGDDANARKYLAIVHNRAFKGNSDPDFEAYIKKCGSVYDAVIYERALEFVGEGMRRHDLVRTGKLPKACVDNRALMTAVVDGVHENGFYRFDNGNELPAYVWTKMVDAKRQYGYRLTAQCTDESDPVLFPGWRGQHDDWGSIQPAFKDVNETNVAIRGLFKYIKPGSDEAKALEADGYVQTNWGVDMYDYRDSYATKLLCGYSDADYAAKNPPIYLIPNRYNDLQNSGITNGYGFRQK